MASNKVENKMEWVSGSTGWRILCQRIYKYSAICVYSFMPKDAFLLMVVYILLYFCFQNVIYIISGLSEGMIIIFIF